MIVGSHGAGILHSDPRWRPKACEEHCFPRRFHADAPPNDRLNSAWPRSRDKQARFDTQLRAASTFLAPVEHCTPCLEAFCDTRRSVGRAVVVAWGGKKTKTSSSVKVEVKEASTAEPQQPSVVLTAKTKPGQSQASVAENANVVDQKASRKLLGEFGTTATVGEASPAWLKRVTSSPVGAWSAGLAIAGTVAVLGALVAKRLSSPENTVDALARRGFISSDRSVKLEVIKGFEDPTRVRDYKLGNAKLVELEPLKPLTEEKMRQHRELRRREHGWKKPEHVLVEGEEIPEGVDPMTVRFIPKKHPFALNSDETDEQWSEEVARRRLRQRRGRPEKEQLRSKQQLERLRREMETRDSSAAGSGDNGNGRIPSERRSGIVPNIDD